MFAAEILHRARPVDIGQQAVIAQAQLLQSLGRGNVEHFFQRGPGPHLVHAPQQQHRRRQTLTRSNG